MHPTLAVFPRVRDNGTGGHSGTIAAYVSADSELRAFHKAASDNWLETGQGPQGGFEITHGDVPDRETQHRADHRAGRYIAPKVHT